MGIDPGTNCMGYALLKVVGKKPVILVSGILDLKKLGDPYLKLQRIFRRTLQVIDEYQPMSWQLNHNFLVRMFNRC